MMATTQSPAPLMTEEEVRVYFLHNGGLVRNSDIVTYFRTYLANPAIRDEARAVFKTIVNKLATVKVENGEKFLVLKRQYFSAALPLDGNGNRSRDPDSPALSNTHSRSQSSLLSSGGGAYASGHAHTPPYHHHSSEAHGLPQPPSQPQPSFTPFPYQAPPPYISHSPYPHLSKSQPLLHSSQFSLNSVSNSVSNSMSNSTTSQVSSQAFPDPLSSLSSPTNQQPPFLRSASSPAHKSLMPRVGLGGEDDYGLPPPPAVGQNRNTPPRRLSFSSSPSGPSSGGSVRMIPPPYRPPPPAPAYLSSPPSPAGGGGGGGAGGAGGGTRAGLPNFRNPGPSSRYNNQQQSQHQSSPSRAEPFPAFPYQRSLSVSGISGFPQQTPPVVVQKGSHSASPSTDHQPFFPLVGSPGGIGSLLQSPPPPVPPRTKRSLSFLEKSPGVRVSYSSSTNTLGMEETGSGQSAVDRSEVRTGRSGSWSEAERRSEEALDKENASPPEDSSSEGHSLNEEADPNSSEAEQKISVKERMEKFNKISSESDLAPKIPNGNSNSRTKRDNKHDSGDYDTSSLSSYGCYAQTEPKGREWILKAARSDYAGVNKMAQDMPSLVKRKDINGYTSLHWAAKLGNLDMVKLLAGTYSSDVNSKSNGGYTPLHLAAQFSRQEIYDVLVKVYNADPNLRDHSGKKPMQYMVRQDTAVSVDTFKKLKEKRRSTEQQRERDSNSFLRIGSLNVRVKKTTEAFGNFIGKSNSGSNIERILNTKKWGSTESLPETESWEKDEEMMPPPSGPSVPNSSSKGKRSKSRKSVHSDNPQLSPSSQPRKSPASSAKSSRIQETNSGSDSDTACGFGQGWKGT